MTNRPRIGIAVQPRLVRTAVHAALARNPWVDAVLLPDDLDVRLQASEADVDALLVSSTVVRPDVPVVRAAADGTLDVTRGSRTRTVSLEDVGQIVALVLAELDPLPQPDGTLPAAA